MQYLQTLQHNVRSHVWSPEVAAVNLHTGICSPELSTRLGFGTFCVEFADGWLPCGIVNPLKERVRSLPTYFCHLSPLRNREGRSIHPCASPDEAVYPEKKIARVADTKDQRKERVAQSNKKYIWLMDKEHGHCSLLQKYFRRTFFHLKCRGIP